ncbi:cytochrome p450 [Stylonychia lemnae]|uniref:Cytochrome p450 n=1 Tax=Stylonychia lemnae TaxID=5949 RepID=A0A078AJK1_STYLE|nr:cytochrome p450 [Stylonychia lemnae]|eukprot:CDW80978.1 cytochrome p450 [Stylonychia lemnae]
MILSYLFYAFLIYVLWEKILKPYYYYWYYTSQGIRAICVPKPLIFNMLILKKVLKNLHEYSEQLLYEYYLSQFKNEQIPSIFIDFRSAAGQLVVSDPDILQELFVTKGKYVDKLHRSKKVFYDLTGESVLFDQTTEAQATKRKHLSTAFYKDKMTFNLRIIIRKTYGWIENLKIDIKKGNNERELNSMINQHILDCILMSVFGETSLKQTMPFLVDDKIVETSLGIATARLFLALTRKSITPLRILVQLFDSHYIGKSEKALQKNLQTFREFLQRLINEKKEKMQDPSFEGADFLTMLLTDDLFSKDESLIKDELATILIASILTTTALITNTLYYYEFLPEVKQKLRKEISMIMSPDRSNPVPFENLKLSPELWVEKLDYDQLQEDWKYLYLVIQESLRIEPPARSSTPMQLNQTMEIGGYTVDKNTSIAVHFYLLHRNPQEWQQPSKFIPERFDPESPYYLTPDGKKRKPNSFSPFLGGRRICLGKTFAENIAKCVIPIIISELDIKFKNDYHYERKPPKNFATEINVPIILSAIQKN